MPIPTRALTALVASAVAAIGVGVTAAPATAAVAQAAGCTASTSLPTRVSIDRAVQQVPITLRTTCSADYADAFLAGPDGDYDVPFWEAPLDGSTYLWEAYGDSTVPGTYRTEEIELYQGPDDLSPEGLTTTDGRAVAKFGSKAGLTAARTGSRVTLTACASYYNGRRDAFVPWSAHRATIQRLGADGRTWEYVKTVGTNARGCAVLDVAAPVAATYRVTTYETYQIFSRTSPTVRA
ncbi:hypothetical protein WDV85_00415 [Pseudokineococcus sp. 5B2Z-1]|uniref:hypothetical protein n=1 Tax=Pseudokineococcus sp. 5B2Z-1 TaxID=3132744 RepID=UPI0030AFB18A